MLDQADKYAHFVEHPRYGRGPHFTGLNPSETDPGVYVGHSSTYNRELNTSRNAIIPDTAIVADLDRQTPAVTLPITHYFDLERECWDCGRPFIFFAQEQKHWYEDLGFGLDSDCIRCIECRKKQQGLARMREKYETLFHVANRDVEQNLQMADACLSLIESGDFNRRRTQSVRMLFNSIPNDADVRDQPRFAQLMNRLLEAERQQ